MQYLQISLSPAQLQKVLVTLSVLVLVAVAAVAIVRTIPAVEAQVTYSWATNVYMWDDFGCTGGYNVGTPFGSCNASTVGQGWASVQCLGNVQCYGGDPSNCGNMKYTEVTCTAQCTADASCAATTNVGNTCTDSCGNVYAGTLVPTCANGSAGPYPACPTNTCVANVSQACSASNSCSMSNAGTVNCDGSCSASAPSESLCAPVYSQSSYYSEASYAPSCTGATVSVTASPSRVKSGQTSTLTITGSGISGTCTIAGPGVSQSFPASSCAVSGTVTTPAITARSNYTVTCDGGATAKASVLVPFGVMEF